MPMPIPALMNMKREKMMGGRDANGNCIGCPPDTYRIQNPYSNPANEPWRNGMTDFSLMNLDMVEQDL